MRIYAPPGAAPGGAHLITQHLEHLQAKTGVKWVRTDGDATPNPWQIIPANDGEQ